MALYAVVTGGLQVAGGAYRAEFNGHADEAAHFVSGLLVRDYAATWPPESPVPWAAQYYMHYPKVAIGHWPPGYYAVLAAWWLVTPVGRTSALVFNILLTVAAMAFFYDLARRIRPGWPAVGAGLIAVCTWVLQEANGMVMADVAALVCGMALLWTLARLLEEPGIGRMARVALALGGSVLVKGTGIALVLAPVAALASAPVRRWFPAGKILVLAVTAAGGVTALGLWQFGSIDTIRDWAGVGSRIPWKADFLPLLIGPVGFVLALGGVWLSWRNREPVGMAAAAVLGSMAAVAYVVRAMKEPRHWIVAIPALLLLALTAYVFLERRFPRLAAAVIVLGMVVSPFGLYRQEAEGFRELAGRVNRPGRMLVSSALGWREGPWIAVVAETERRPGSMVARGTKLLAESAWNGNGYRSRVSDCGDVERLVDETGIDTIVLDGFAPPAGERAPHHDVLRGCLEKMPAWRQCERVRELTAYCRQAPPRYARKPLEVDLRARLGYVIVEDYKEARVGEPMRR